MLPEVGRRYWQLLNLLVCPSPLADYTPTLMNVLIGSASRSNGRERQTTGGSVPNDAFDAMGIDSPRPGGSGAGGGGDGGGDVGGERICPHCTFVNEGSGSDCEICGLPLSG